MDAPDELLEAVRTSTAALVTALQDGSWSDADVRAPSLLPGWSRGHVLTHIARNADGIAVTLEGALRGEDVPRYPHGMAGRNADIEDGSGRSPEALIEDVGTSAARLDAVFARVLAAGPPVLTRTADKNTPVQWLGARWREVEIHHVDLGLDSYGPRDWPAEFVERQLLFLHGRTGAVDVVGDPAEVLFWRMGRGTGPSVTRMDGSDVGPAPAW